MVAVFGRRISKVKTELESDPWVTGLVNRFTKPLDATRLRVNQDSKARGKIALLHEFQGLRMILVFTLSWFALGELQK
jgi:hypothetical protein